jgi:cytochrome P450
MTIGDTTVPKGDVMMLLLAAAHHDPAAVDRPDEFDPDRETIRHLGFGKGRTAASARRWRGWKRPLHCRR